MGVVRSAMELTALRYFRAIAQARQLTRAAESLGVTQPALSSVLRKLEAECGTALFSRTGRGVELTDAGQVFLAFADESLAAADAGLKAVRQITGLETGSIRVGGGATATDYLLPGVVRAVRRKHPALRFYVREAGSAAVAASVLSGELDLAIVTLPVQLPSGQPGRGELLSIPLVKDELRLIVPPNWKPASKPTPLSARTGFRWKEIEGEPFVAFEAGSAVRSVIDQAAEAAGVRLNVVMELRSIESIKSMVAAGIGVGLVSRFALREDEGYFCKDGRITRDLAIVRRRDRVPSAAAAAFERELKAAMKR